MTADLSVVVMCTANRCRSPMAEAMLAKALPGASVSSMGVLASGAPVVGEVLKLMTLRGFDVSSHRSRRISGEIVGGADLILAMERAHLREVATVEPAALARSFTLREFVRRAEASPRADQPLGEWLGLLSMGRSMASLLQASGEDDLADPMGRSRATFERTADQLDNLTTRAAHLLR